MEQGKRTIYLEPMNAFTNQVFADFPFDEALITEVRVFPKGDPIKVWEVTERQLEYAVASRETPNIFFRMYQKREGEQYVSLFSLPAPVVQKIRAARVLETKKQKSVH